MSKKKSLNCSVYREPFRFEFNMIQYKVEMLLHMKVNYNYISYNKKLKNKNNNYAVKHVT